MNEHVYAGRCVTPGCKAPGETVADSYTLVKLGIVGRRGKVCQGCLRGVEVGKRQLLSSLQTGGGDARRLQISGGEVRRLQLGGGARKLQAGEVARRAGEFDPFTSTVAG